MAWSPDYITAAQLKSALGIADAVDDAEIGFAITAASRAIDHYTGRQFGSEASAVSRYYTPVWDHWRRYIVEIDDLMSENGLLVKSDPDDDLTFPETLTDYRLAPLNNAANGRPWTLLIVGPDETAPIPRREGSIQVTAEWGWTSVPGLVTQAALIQAARFFKRKDAPFGIAGSPELGSELRLLPKLDPDVQLSLSPLIRYWGAR